MRKVGWSLAVAVLLAAVCAPMASAQNANSCPQVAAEVDFLFANANALASGDPKLFDLDTDGAEADCGSNCTSVLGVPSVEVVADGIPDIIHVAVIEALVKTGSEFYSASDCAIYQSNYAETTAAITAAGLAGLFPGGDEIVAALTSLDKDNWIPVIIGFVYESVPIEIGMDPADYTNIPDIKATDDRDGDGVSLLDEWTALGAIYDDQSDTWTLPGKTNADVYAAFATAALAGTNVVVTITASPSATIFIGGTTTLSASSNADPVDTGFTYTSSDDNIATVDSGGVVSGVNAGTATITVTANPSGAIGTQEIIVEEPVWSDVCSLDNVFAGEGAALAAALGAQIGAPSDFAQWDLELFVGDGVPDSYQLQHLAYILCTGGIESKDVDKASVVTEYQTNKAAVDAFFAQVVAIPDAIDALAPELEAAGDDITTWLGAITGGASPATELGALATIADGLGAGLGAQLFGDGTPMGTNGATFSGTGPALAAAAGSGTDVESIGGSLPIVANVLTGLWGLSSEYNFTILGLLQDLSLITASTPTGSSLEEVLLTLPQASQAVQAYGGILGAAATANASGPLAGTMPETAAIAASLIGLQSGAAFFATEGTPAPLAVPSITVYGTSAKLAGEPFAGDGDGNPNDSIATNGDVYSGVNGAGGDVNDYIAGVTGEFGPFWAGNPALPVGGTLALSALIATLGATVIRRKRK